MAQKGTDVAQVKALCIFYTHVSSIAFCFLLSWARIVPCRDYRRYFYTHKLTGKTQWDYPDADDIEKEEKKAATTTEKKVATTTEKRVKREVEPEISSTSDRVKEYSEWCS